MSEAPGQPGDAVTLGSSAFEELIGALRRRGHTVLGPVVRDGAIVLSELAAASDLAQGVTDDQAPGRYRLRPAADGRAFGYTHGPDSIKRALHLPELPGLRADRNGRSFVVDRADPRAPPLALFGLRSCDLAALGALDRILLGGAHADPAYAARRQGMFTVAVSCTQPAGTCFCASLGTGPRPQGAFDIRLTELGAGGKVRLLAESGSQRGAALLAEVPHEAATGADRAAAEESLSRAAASQCRKLPLEGLQQWLLANYENPHWDAVGKRCLACGNCTLVCPTCFCTRWEDRTNLAGSSAWRLRLWDSCFTLDFSHIHGGSVRPSVRARYRQWLMHKLATFPDQFGVAGCVGCGRCITWCPAGIDLVEEVRALRRAGGIKEEQRGGDA